MSIYPFNLDAPRAPRAQRLLEDERGIVDDRSFSEVIFGSLGGGLQRGRHDWINRSVHKILGNWAGGRETR